MVAAASVVFDVVALPPETPVIKPVASSWVKRPSAVQRRLALQAVEQFAMYTGMRPDDALIAEAAEFARAG